MGEWIMETITGDDIGTTIGIHSRIPYEAPDSPCTANLQSRVAGPLTFPKRKHSNFSTSFRRYLNTGPGLPLPTFAVLGTGTVGFEGSLRTMKMFWLRCNVKSTGQLFSFPWLQTFS